MAASILNCMRFKLLISGGRKGDQLLAGILTAGVPCMVRYSGTSVGGSPLPAIERIASWHLANGSLQLGVVTDQQRHQVGGRNVVQALSVVLRIVGLLR